MNCENRPADINFPDPMPDFNSPNSVGTWKQLFATNIGKPVKIEISLFDSTLLSVTGELYIVGESYVGVMCDGKVCLVDVYAIKRVTFF